MILGAFLYRLRGMNNKYRPWAQIIFSFPFAWVVYETYKDAHLEPVFFLSLCLTVWVFTSLSVLTGHGNGIDLGTYEKETEDEATEFLVKWLKKSLTPKAYDVLLLSMTGLLVTLPAGLVTLNPILAVWGILKGPCYLLAEWGLRKHTKDAHIEAGELLTGAILWGALC